MTATKLNHRLPQTADRKAAFEVGVEAELRKRLQLLGSGGIVSIDGADVDNDLAPCALSVNVLDPTAFDVLSGTVVFGNGEFVDVSATDIVGRIVDSSITDGQVVRLEYGEVEDGPLEANPYYNFASYPLVRKKTAAEMLVVETVAVYNAQTATVKNRSVVLGVVRFDGTLVVDNGRDTYSFSRPWFSLVDVEHRSKVGTGTVTDNNPHGTALNDLTVGNYTAWQALVGVPPCVLARPNGTGRFPGEICVETLPAGAFATDSTGLITGVAGALYAPLGFWPHRLLRASLTSSAATQVAAWIPKGRNVVACFDPLNFSSAASLDVVYTKVTAGALPGAMSGLQTLTVSQPGSEELIVAGGNFFEELVENKVYFSDVGLIPMQFDVLVDGTGRAYKSPDVIYCNTSLDTLGSSPQPFTIQPRVPSRLRVAIANYVVGFTEVRLLISGVGEDGSIVSETVTFSGPGVLPQPSYDEVTELRKFTANVFEVVNQIQVTVRNGDGPNTTVTVFAEGSPQRPGTQDDLLLATVQWTGSEVTSIYSNDPNVAIDRRLITTGGGDKGVSPVETTLNSPMVADSLLGYLPTGVTKWVTLAEDFANPMYMEYPNSYVGVQTSELPVELPANSLGARNRYISRLIPFGQTFSEAMDALWLRMIPRGMDGYPGRRFTNFAIFATLYGTSGTTLLTGILPPNPYPPHQVQLSGSIPAGTYYGIQISMHVPGSFPVDPSELFQGFVFHCRE